MVPAPSAGYNAARHGAGLIERHDVGRLLVSGRDRRSYLHGLLTNDIESLRAGQGCYAAYLTAQGRMISDLWVYELGDAILVTLPIAVKDTVLARLDQFVFSEDVQLSDVTDAFAGVAIVGPLAVDVCSRAMDAAPALFLELGRHGNRRVPFRGHPAIVLDEDDSSVAGYEVVIEREMVEELRDALHAAGALDVDDTAALALRVEAGVPKFGRDMFDDTIPLEAGIEGRAISMTKGCYVGQEVIVRVLHRGHGRLAKRLVGLVLDSEAVPASGAAVRSNGRDIGHVTSSVWSPSRRRVVALAYLQRDHTTAGTIVEVNGAGAEVVSLPFVSPVAGGEGTFGADPHDPRPEGG